jgi:hypothetical protein
LGGVEKQRLNTFITIINNKMSERVRETTEELKRKYLDLEGHLNNLAEEAELMEHYAEQCDFDRVLFRNMLLGISLSGIIFKMEYKDFDRLENAVDRLSDGVAKILENKCSCRFKKSL